MESTTLFVIPLKPFNFKKSVCFALMSCFDCTWAFDYSEMWCGCHPRSLIRSSKVTVVFFVHLFICFQCSKFKGNCRLATAWLRSDPYYWPGQCLNWFFLKLKFAFTPSVIDGGNRVQSWLQLCPLFYRRNYWDIIGVPVHYYLNPQLSWVLAADVGEYGHTVPLGQLVQEERPTLIHYDCFLPYNYKYSTVA